MPERIAGVAVSIIGANAFGGEDDTSTEMENGSQIKLYRK